MTHNLPKRWLPVGFCASLLLLPPTLTWGAEARNAPGSEAPGISGRTRAVAVSGMGGLTRLKRELGDERFELALKLSRVDAGHAGRLDTLIVPAAGMSHLDVSPFPRSLAETDSIPKLLLVSLRLQAFSAYESGRLVMWGPICSGGPQSPTRAGLHHANWKDRDHVSSVDSTWSMPWTVNIDDRVGTALHQYSLPGRPSSHCCIRLLETDAKWVFGWIETRSGNRKGTPVVLFGAYRFDAPRPWMSLPAGSRVATIGDADIHEALAWLHGSGVASDGEEP